MPKYTAPQGVKEAIEFEFMGQEFRITAVPPKAMVVARGLQKSEDTMQGMIDFIRAVINDDERFTALGELDVRQIMPLFTWLTETTLGAVADTEKKSSKRQPRSSASSVEESVTETV